MGTVAEACEQWWRVGRAEGGVARAPWQISSPGRRVMWCSINAAGDVLMSIFGAVSSPSITHSSSSIQVGPQRRARRAAFSEH